MFSYSAKANYPGSPAVAPAWCYRGSWESPQPSAGRRLSFWEAAGGGRRSRAAGWDGAMLPLVPDPRTAPPASCFIPGCPHPHHPPIRAAGGLWPGGDTRAAPMGMWPQQRSLGLVPLSLGEHRGCCGEGGTSWLLWAAPPQLSPSFSARC